MRRLMLIGVLLSALATVTARAEQRIALVIGNSAYQQVERLANPVNDAADMAAALERIGFSVRLETDLTYDAMRRALRDFSAASADADMAVLYFAGHGFEIDRQNYLVPVDARLAADRDVPYEAVPIDHLLAAVGGARTLRLVVLDACRNNPFASTMRLSSAQRSLGRGLARIEPTAGVLVGYAAKEGTTAADGDGRNSPYTAALLAHLGEPGLEVDFLFRKVRDAVMQSTGGRQEPFTYGSLPGQQIFLVPPERVAPTPQASSTKELEVELKFWDSIKDSNSRQRLKAYLDAYPDGRFAALARAMMDELSAAPAAPAVPMPMPKPVNRRPADAAPPPKKEPARREKTATAPQPSTSEASFKMNNVCRSWFSRFKSGHQPHAAFAVAANGSCGWSAGGYASLKPAVAEALHECRKQHPQCKVVLTK